MQMFGKESAKLFANTKVQIFGKEKCKLIANFSAKMVTSLPSFSPCISLSLSLSLSLSHRAHLTHNIGSASALPIIDPLSRPLTVRILRRMRTVSKIATFLATESVNSAPFMIKL